MFGCKIARFSQQIVLGRPKGLLSDTINRKTKCILHFMVARTGDV